MSIAVYSSEVHLFLVNILQTFNGPDKTLLGIVSNNPTGYDSISPISNENKEYGIFFFNNY
ncbi:MAG: hypothetical protein LBI98_00940 [Endomicrobium sp.]|jgi:hypothetical protein|nr:hypothetical protein [Endomicrobium sp.]